MVKRTSHQLGTEREAALLWYIRQANLTPPTTQYRFHQVRRWRFDVAWPKQKVAVELDGGQYKHAGGRHNSDADREKLNTAAALGWRVLRFSWRQLQQDPVGCITLISQALRNVA